MPELPEVQTTVDGVKKHLVGLTIRDAWSDYNSPFYKGKGDIKDPAYFARFRKAVRDAKIKSASRRGKNVLIHLSNGKTILIHMKMTGHVMYGRYEKAHSKKADVKDPWHATEPGPLRDDPFNRFIHFVLSFSNDRHMVLSDMRKFAKVTLIDTAALDQSPHLSSHGPEPLEKGFNVKALIAVVSKKPNGAIKTVLMNPEIVSGIGNIYSDEILWRAGIHPLERVKNIPARKWLLVYKAIRQTLLRGIGFGGDSMSDYRNILGERGDFQEKHRAYRRTGERCSKPACPGTIRRLVIGGRSAHFCDAHQKLSKID